MALTEISIRNLPVPSHGRIQYVDRSQKGFAVLVTETGHKSFVLTYGQDRRRTKIGDVGVIGLADARATAKRILSEHTLGVHRAPSISFEQLVTQFLQACATKNKPRTIYDYRRLLNRHFVPKWRRTDIGNLTAREIGRAIDKLGETPSEANHAFAALRAVLGFAVRRQYLSTHPMISMQLPSRRTPRSRVLSDEELAKVFAAAASFNSTLATIIQLCILTGQRRGEIAMLRREYIEDDLITLPAEVVKNNRDHTFPISESAQTILSTLPAHGYLFPTKSGTVFNGWTKHKRRFDLLCPIDPWTLHDLRRTVATGMAALGVPQIVVEKLLNHVSGGTQSPIAQVYNRHAYLKEMRQALLQWEAHL
ncbi:MAG: tyrosine-type recombinase/integrase, partial [Rhodospirillaceae bacterium]|nr:tyrosine-type recombinase/integrase [Rhodospirillaceae bacterium]